MRSSIAATILAFASVAAAQPHRHHRHQQFHQLDKRDDIIVVEAVIVGVQPDGNPVTTYTSLSTSTIETATTTVIVSEVSAPASTSDSVPPSAPTEEKAATPTPNQEEAQVVESVNKAVDHTEPEAPTVHAATSEGSGGLFGVTYGPYDDEGIPKDQFTIDADIAKLKGYGVVRVYDANDRTAMVMKAAKANGIKVFAGVNNDAMTSGKLSEAINFIVEGGKAAGFDSLFAVGVGNEWTFGGRSASELMGHLGTVKSALSGAGYSGPVVAPDTTASYAAHPELCNGDFASVHAHAFFQGDGCPVDQAAQSVKAQYDSIVQVCGGKKVYISETGWPKASGPGAKSVGSPENQKKVIESIKAAFPEGNVCFISAFDEPWKVKYSPDPMGIETHWGLLD